MNLFVHNSFLNEKYFRPSRLTTRPPRYYSNYLDLIGNTPLVFLNRSSTLTNTSIYAKLELFNAGGSVKSRIAKSLIEYAEQKGQLTKESIIIEATSGNTGIGLALVATIKGYKIRIYMPENASEERKKILQLYGAELVLTPKEEGIDGAIHRVRKLAEEDKKYVWLNQYDNEVNWQTHYCTTAVEIDRALQGKVDIIVGGIGTSGTMMGIAKYFRKHHPETKIVVVQPDEDTPIAGLKNMSTSINPLIYEPKYVDRFYFINFEEAERAVKRLAIEEGMLVGFSSGAAFAAAMREAKKYGKEKMIVVIFPDTGERYLNNI
ncbi:MAG: PLP-dependent cysteine synthase family protein [Candidatus Heimdallarchaeaceae archaeon]